MARYSEIFSLLDQGNITKVVKKLIEVFKLSSGVIGRIGYAAKIDAAAAVDINLNKLYQPGSRAATLYFRASHAELSNEKRVRVIHMIAHELSHVRMRMDFHALRESEFATDALAFLVTGGVDSYKEAFYETTTVAGIEMPTVEYGYIRRDLWPEIFLQLRRYADVIYLK